MKRIIIPAATLTPEEIMKYTSGGETNGQYHRTGHQSKFRNRSGGAPFLIGIEAEKEDLSVKNIKHDTLFDLTKWRKENDGSLDSRSGFEVISPIFSLSRPETLLQDLSQPIIQYLLNANSGPSCGNHFHISQHEGQKPAEILNGIQAYIPLLYAMYESRKGNHYCQAKNVDRMISQPDKYSAVNLSGYGTMEFRIFPALKSTKQLQFRLNLILSMLENSRKSAYTILTDMLSPKSDLFQTLIEAYNTEDKYRKMMNRYIKNLTFAANSLNNGIDESFLKPNSFDAIKKYFKQVPAESIDGENEQDINLNGPNPNYRNGVISGSYHSTGYRQSYNGESYLHDLNLFTDSGLPDNCFRLVRVVGSQSGNKAMRVFTKVSLTGGKLDQIKTYLRTLSGQQTMDLYRENYIISFAALEDGNYPELPF